MSTAAQEHGSDHDARAYYRLEATDAAAGTETFTSTEETVSGWGPDLQHGGPPAALLTRAIERVAPFDGRLNRVAIDLWGAVPVAPVTTRAWIARPGRRIGLIRAEMTAGGRTVATASAWHLRTAETGEVLSESNSRLTTVEETTGKPADFFGGGFVESLDIRGTRGDPMWLRTEVPLVAGEDTSSPARAMMLSDVANGVGAELDHHEWTLMNVDLVAHFVRVPTGEWTGIEARGWIGPDGQGVTRGTLHDAEGPFAFTHQGLLVERR